MKNLLFIDQVSISLSKKTILHDINISVDDFCVLGILGANGVGKSSLMKAIAGILPIDSGLIKICGVAIHENRPLFNRNLGYLPEFNPLYNYMYVNEFLSFIANIRGVSRANLKKNCQHVIDACGLSEVQYTKISTLSKGYRQRVGVAHSIIHNPQVVILDEPTSGLDFQSIHDIRNLIKNISQNKLVILSSHLKDDIEILCDNTIYIKNGSIAK